MDGIKKRFHLFCWCQEKLTETMYSRIRIKNIDRVRKRFFARPFYNNQFAETVFRNDFALYVLILFFVYAPCSSG